LSPDDAYAVLGLSPGASEAQIKSAWRRLVSRWHPDRNTHPEAVLHMQRINRAFECLQAGLEDSQDAPDEPSQADSADDFAPEAQAERTAQAPPPIWRRMRVSLDEAALGCVRTLRGRASLVCQVCAGSGQKPGPNQSCPDCRGQGKVMQATWYGWGRVAVDCERCAGTGVLRSACQACQGEGCWPDQPWRLRVRLPAGARDGDVLVVPVRPGQTGQAPADLHLRVVLEPHPLFRLDEAGALHCRMPVDGFAWMAGRWVEVPVPGGWQQMRLHRKHLSYRLKGQGFPVERRGERGDLFIHVEPVFPEALSPQQEELIERLMASQAEQQAAQGGRLHDWAQQVSATQNRRQRRRRAHAGSR
jgi:molecular chaperone DnaJ